MAFLKKIFGKIKIKIIIKLNLGKNKILFGIVCFREKFWETQSFKDLLTSYKMSAIKKILSIYIYDNTDKEGWDLSDYKIHEDDIELQYFHDAHNSGISSAFNHLGEFAKTNQFKWIVFLDQDTELPLDFYEKYYALSISKESENIAFPKILSNSHLLSPSEYNYYRTKPLVLQNEKKLELGNITAINSGLMIKTFFFLDQGGYNKNLRIDFCDHEFMERIPKKMFADLIDVYLNQNFSLETNDNTKSLSRYRIYVKDMIVYRKDKNKFIFFFRVDLPHLLKEIFRNKSLEFLKIRLQS